MSDPVLTYEEYRSLYETAWRERYGLPATGVRPTDFETLLVRAAFALDAARQRKRIIYELLLSLAYNDNQEARFTWHDVQDLIIRLERGEQEGEAHNQRMEGQDDD